MNPRVARFRISQDDKTLDMRIEQLATKIERKPRADAFSECEDFALRAAGIFLADDQVRGFLRRFDRIAEQYADACFGANENFVRHLHARNPWGDVWLPAICFTGISGVGKSKVLDAYKRLHSVEITCDLPGYRNMPMVAAWHLNLEDGPGLNGLLCPLLWPTQHENLTGSEVSAKNSSQPKSRSISTLLNDARRRAWRDAVCFTFIDEFQNISKTAVTARATLLLNRLLTLGPRLLYCANFGLVSALSGGHPEDRRRLLGNPIEVLPDAKGSPAFLRHIDALKGIAPDDFAFDTAECQEFIHNTTYGVKSHVATLLKCGLLAAKIRRRSGAVELGDLEKAASSDMYSATSDVVDLLWSQYVQNKKIDPRFWSPFRQGGDPHWYGEEVASGSRNNPKGKVVVAQRAVDEYKKRLDDALIEAARQPEEVAAPDAPVAPVRRRQKVVRLAPRGGQLNDLKHGADVLDDL